MSERTENLTEAGEVAAGEKGEKEIVFPLSAFILLVCYSILNPRTWKTNTDNRNELYTYIMQRNYSTITTQTTSLPFL